MSQMYEFISLPTQINIEPKIPSPLLLHILSNLFRIDITFAKTIIMRIGIGYDVHALVSSRKLILGGIEIAHYKGLQGHSDADVLIHAICDALLGALALGDIGNHFPDTSEDFKDIDSKILLKKVHYLLTQKHYKIVNIDSVLMLEEPVIKDYIPLMQTQLASVLKIDDQQISIKATTTERLGFIGREEGIAAQAVCLLDKIR